MLKKPAILIFLIFLGFLACSDDDSGVGNVDGIFPAAIDSLQVVDTTATSLKLWWRAPGDDSLTGNASAYDIRMASSAEYLIYYWNDALAVPNVPTPAAVGLAETLWVDSLSFYFEYFFAIRTLDESGNISYISNIAVGRPFADSIIIFADDSLDAVIHAHLGIDPDSTLWYSKVLELDTLNGANKEISKINDLFYAANLTKINLANNRIDSIEVLSQLPSLDSLVLSYNRIADIDSLSGLTNLQYLYLDSNKIDSIDALAGLYNLTHINLDSNLIESIYPLVLNTGLDSGDYVWIRDNPLTDTLTGAYIDTLEAHGVTVTY